MTPPIGVALLVLVILAGFTAHLAPLAGAAATLGSFALCFVPYALAIFWLRKHTEPRAIWWVLGAGILVRLLLLFAEPLLSDDIYRYVWEGRVTLAGYNPFVHPPNSEVLAALRDDVIWPSINHAEVPAIYPPISQFVFAGVALVGGGVFAMKVVLVALELLAVAAAWVLGSQNPQRLFALAVYLLNPLVFIEVAWSGHLDVLAWSTLVLSLMFLARPGLRGAASAGVLLGVSIGAKLLGLILVPYLVLRRVEPDASLARAAKRRAVMLGCAGLVVLSSYAVFSSQGGLFGGFGKYAASWRSNDGLFRAWETVSWITLQQGEGDERIFELSQFDEFAVEHGFTKEWEGQILPDTSFATNQISQTVAKVAAAGAMGLVLLFCIVCVRDPVVAAIILIGALYVVAPTIHPWYVAWLVPLAALRFNITSIAFSLLVLCAYVAWASYSSGGAWLVPTWVVVIEFGTVLLIAGWEVGRIRVEN